MDYLVNGLKSLFGASAPAAPTAAAKPNYPFEHKSVKIQQAQYENSSASGLSTVGYYYDFTDKVGNRPVMKSYTDAAPSASRAMQLTNKQFNCSQPVWGEHCH